MSKRRRHIAAAIERETWRRQEQRDIGRMQAVEPRGRRADCELRHWLIHAGLIVPANGRGAA